MGRRNVKDAPIEVQNILDYMNGGGIVFTEGSHRHHPKPYILDAAKGFLATLIEIARQPVHDQDILIRLYHRVHFEGGYMRLEPIAHDNPVWDQVLKLPTDSIKRILLCPNCKQFVWRKKIDSETCSRKCADKWNNEKRKQRRKEDGSL